MINLKMKKNQFKILNFSDIQLSSSEWNDGHKHREIVIRTVGELVKRVKPDLITLSGDLAWAGEFTAYEKLSEYMNSFGIPWTLVWGNHDNQRGTETVDKQVEIVTSKQSCLYEKGPAKLGNGNFVITIDNGSTPVSALIMMDSHDCRPPLPHEGNVREIWDELWPEQFEWYKEQTEQLRRAGYNTSAMIMHIPIYAYREAFAAASSGAEQRSVLPWDSLGSDLWNEEYKDTFGVNYEGICSHPYDNGFFELVRDLDHTKLILSGHDHLNNSCINYKGIRLAYSTNTGPGCYYDPILNGGTVITIDTEGKLDLHHEYVDVSDIL